MVFEEQIVGFGTSMLAKFPIRTPWELTRSSVNVVEQLLSRLGDGYVVSGNVAIHTTSTIEDSAIIKGPAIIGAHCFVAAGAYVRDGCWLEADCILGPGTELKSSFIFRASKLAHFNFVGDSILGCEVNLEAGSIIANYRNEQANRAISFIYRDKRVDTGIEKFGALVGDRAKIGANAVIAPGAIINADTVVKRLSLIDQGVATSAPT